MDDAFKIYVEQLKDGHTERIKESFPPDFLNVHEKQLEYPFSVDVEGEVYIADEELVLHLNVVTQASIPCSVCNEQTLVAIEAEGVYYTVSLDEIKGGVFYFNDVLREIVLLETPPFAECGEGNCPNRNEFEKYLKKPGEKKSEQDEDGYHPFADLNNIDDLT